MSNQADYYLESLITEAFKGKGFQKINELFEEKISFSLQRHGKALLNVLDKLINKELDRNEFKHVSLLMKCVQNFCKNESQEDLSLIQQGLISKMVLWFERTLELLKIWDESSYSVPELVEQFFDTAVIICRSNNKDGIKQLLDSFLFHLGYIITEKWPAFDTQLEAIKTFNHILDHVSREDTKTLQSSEEMITLLKIMARKLFDVGDYDGQAAISEALCRMTPRNLRENLVRQWFADNFFASAFLEINDKDFETDCRLFLNCLNLRSQDEIRVYTYPCVNVFADTEKLTRPQDSKVEHFWIDFNTGSNCISFYIQNPQGVLWDSVRLQKHSITGYNLQETGDQQQLDIYPKTPILINHKETKHLRIYFENEHDIESAVIKIYGEEMKMTIRNQDANYESANQANSSPPVFGTSAESKPQSWEKGQSNPHETEVESYDLLHYQSKECTPCEIIADSQEEKDPDFIKPQDTLKDLTDVAKPSNVEKIMKTPIILCRDVRVVLSPVRTKFTDPIPKVCSFYKDVQAKYSEAKGSSPKKQHTEKVVFSPVRKRISDPIPVCSFYKGVQAKYSEAKGSSPKKPCTEKSLSIFEYPDSSHSGTDIELVLEKNKSNSPESSSKRRKLVGTPSRPLTRASLSDEKKTVKYTDVVSSGSAPESEKSWILKHKKSADYSRKKAKRKSKLKVLPLSSESSNEDSKTKTDCSFTFVKQTTQVKGRAESLSFSDVKLPGISGLLTPVNTTVQSGTLTISDLDDQDIMDPLQEISSPEFVQLAKSSRKESVISSTIGSKSVAEDYAEEPQKRKRQKRDGVELALKSQKFFGSCERFSVRSEEVNRSSTPVEDLAECSFISSFESFTKQLQNKMMSTYKNMEIQAQDMLTASHTQVSNLISQIQQGKIRKLQRFHEIVVQELSTLEADTQTLRELEKETMEIWEDQTLKVKQLCADQSKRLEIVLGETKSLLTKNCDQWTEVTENSQTPTKD
ncbi:synaptonemal complex protein 2-like [Mantella aurantiaca]